VNSNEDSVMPAKAGIQVLLADLKEESGFPLARNDVTPEQLLVAAIIVLLEERSR